MVTVWRMSVPHISLTLSVTTVPSCVFSLVAPDAMGRKQDGSLPSPGARGDVAPSEPRQRAVAPIVCDSLRRESRTLRFPGGYDRPGPASGQGPVGPGRRRAIAGDGSSLEKAIETQARARRSTRARPAPGHNNETWKVRPSGSSSRPPSGQRAFWPQWRRSWRTADSLSMVISPTLDCSRAISSSAIVALAFLPGLTPRRRALSIPPFGQLGHRDIRFPGDDIQRFATQQTRHHRHLALDQTLALRSCIDARGAPAPAMGERSSFPSGFSPVSIVIFETSGCGSITAARCLS